MAIFSDNGRLETLETSDLIAVLSTLDSEDCIDMYDQHYCLGARAATLAFTEVLGTAPCIEHGIYIGTVLGADEEYRYTYKCSKAAGRFIRSMMDVQDDEGLPSLPVWQLCRQLDAFTDGTIAAEGWEKAL
ncbi:MAG: hypothetical protein ACXWP0_01125 [Ktedonobacterales bacterium]